MATSKEKTPVVQAVEEASSESTAVTVHYNGYDYVLDPASAVGTIEYWEATQAGNGVLIWKLLLGHQWEAFKSRNPGIEHLQGIDKALEEALGGK